MGGVAPPVRWSSCCQQLGLAALDPLCAFVAPGGTVCGSVHLPHTTGPGAAVACALALASTSPPSCAEGRLLAALAVADPIRPEAPAVIAALRRMGYVAVLLTGDRWRSARAVADQLGILQVQAEVLPGGP